MPDKYLLELLCDYLGAGHAYMGDTFTYQGEYKWWQNKIKNPIAMHPATKAFIDKVLSRLAWREEHNVEYKALLNKKNLIKIYHECLKETDLN